jgi:hypothetical protein
VASIWRVNSGGPAYTDSLGNLWAADENYSGGFTIAVGGAVTGTSDSTLYDTQRYGNSFSYTFNVPAGAYQVTLKFAETYSGDFSSGARVFNVAVNGSMVLPDMDVYAQVGADTEDDKVINNVSPVGGEITIQFAGTSSTDTNAMVEAVQIIPQPPAATFTATPTNTSTATPAATFTATPTNTSTATLTDTFTATPSKTSTATLTATFTATPSKTSTVTLTASFTSTFTMTSSPTFTGTNTPSQTVTLTGTPTLMFTKTFTPSNTGTPTNTPSPTLTRTLTFAPTMTNTATNTPTITASQTFTQTPGNIFTPTSVPANSLVVPEKPLIYPNPSTGRNPVKVLVPLSSISDVRIEIFTVSFRKISDRTYKNTIPGTILSVSVTSQNETQLASGIYYIEVFAENKHWAAPLLIIR